MVEQGSSLASFLSTLLSFDAERAFSGWVLRFLLWSPSAPLRLADPQSMPLPLPPIPQPNPTFWPSFSTRFHVQVSGPSLRASAWSFLLSSPSPQITSFSSTTSLLIFYLLGPSISDRECRSGFIQLYLQFYQFWLYVIWSSVVRHMHVNDCYVFLEYQPPFSLYNACLYSW